MLEAFEHKHPTLKLVLLRASAGSSAVNLLCMIYEPLNLWLSRRVNSNVIRL